MGEQILIVNMWNGDVVIFINYIYYIIIWVMKRKDMICLSNIMGYLILSGMTKN